MPSPEYKLPMAGAASAIATPPKPDDDPWSNIDNGLPDDIEDSSAGGLAVEAIGSALQGQSAAQLQQVQQAPHAELIQYFVNMGINPATAVQLAQKIGAMEPVPPPIANGVRIRMQAYPPDAQSKLPVSATAQAGAADYLGAAGSAVGNSVATSKQNEGVSAGLKALGAKYSIDEWNALSDSDKNRVLLMKINGKSDSKPSSGGPDNVVDYLNAAHITLPGDR